MIPKNHNIYKSNTGESTTNSDFETLKNGFEKNCGFMIGKSSFPCFFTADGHNMHLEDCAKGHGAMIYTDHARILSQYNDKIFGLSLCDIKSNLILTDKDDNQFLNDPTTIKLCPMSLSNIFHKYPLCFYFISSNTINTTINEESIPFNKDISLVYSAIKILYIMGFRKIVINKISPNGEDISYFNKFTDCGVDIKCIENEDEIFGINLESGYKSILS